MNTMNKSSTVLIVILLSSFISFASAARQYLLEGVVQQIPANALCSSLYQTNLATITSLDDQISIENLLLSLNQTFISAWIGLNDIDNERFKNKTDWQFFSGANQTVEFWAALNPKGIANDDCVSVNLQTFQPGARIPWESFSCGFRARYFCDDAESSRYKAILDQSLSYLDAEQFCRNNFQTGLATVRNSAEQDYLKRLIAGFDAWIGFNDQRVEGQFIWTSGLPVTFTNITNFSGGNAENCVEVVGLKTSRIEEIAFGTWRDADCAVAKPFLCDNNFTAFIGGVPTSSPTISPTITENEAPENNPAILIGGVSAAGAAIILAAVGIYRRRRMISSSNSRPMGPLIAGMTGMTARYYWYQNAQAGNIPQPLIVEQATYYDMKNPQIITPPPPGMYEVPINAIAPPPPPPPGL